VHRPLDLLHARIDDDIEQRRLVGDDRAHQLGTTRRDTEHDRAPVGAADQVDGRDVERQDESDQVAFLVAASGRRRPGPAARVTPAVVGEHAEVPGEGGGDEPPRVLVGEAAVHEDDGLAGAVELVVEVDGVVDDDPHLRTSPRCLTRSRRRAR
jgi:hypothetical protein